MDSGRRGAAYSTLVALCSWELIDSCVGMRRSICVSICARMCNMYMYVYIYICMCVCVRVFVVHELVGGT